MFKKRNKVLTIILHCMVWLILFGMPYLLQSDQKENLVRVTAHTILPMFSYATIFYGNYFFLIRKYLFDKKLLWFILINALLIGGLVWGMFEFRSYIFEELLKEETRREGPPRQFFIYIDILASTVPVVFSIALKTTERWVRTETERKEAANIKLQSELQHLKYQLQPHFFFNSLNNIYSLVDISPEKAKETLHSLGKLMRYLLYDTETEKVLLQKEINFMIMYIELMKLRFSDKTQVHYSFPDDKNNISVAPLLFISLIENAFKHGISATQNSTISFTMNITDTSIQFISENRNFAKDEKDKSGSGIGIQNLEKRLQLLYPERHSFTKEVEGDMFRVVLIFDY